MQDYTAYEGLAADYTSCLAANNPYLGRRLQQASQTTRNNCWRAFNMANDNARAAEVSAELSPHFFKVTVMHMESWASIPPCARVAGAGSFE